VIRVSILFTLCIIGAVGCTSKKPSLEPDSQPVGLEAGLWMVMDKAEKELLASGKLVRDPQLQQYVKSIGCKLAPSHCDDIRIYVVRRPDFNAYMAPNGYMVVWTGLLLRTTSEAQLAAIIGHELSHYFRRHALERWEETRAAANVTLGLSIAAAMAGVGPAGQLASVLAIGYLAGYSRDQEREADRMSLDMLAEAGYPPREASKIWSDIIDEREAADEDDPNPFFASHPSSEERFQTLSDLAASMPEHGSPQSNQGFNEHILAHWGTWLADELEAGREKRLEVLLKRLKSTALNPSTVWYFQAELLRRQGQDLNAAARAFKQSLREQDPPAAAYRGLGLVQRDLGNYASARENFQKYLEAGRDAPDRAMIQYYLDTLESE
jgi:beta-barrel assembly-enhancing protease